MTFKDAGGMVSKMGTLGGGNINKVSMGESYLVERKGKKAKAKSDLKNNKSELEDLKTEFLKKESEVKKMSSVFMQSEE